MVLDPNKLKLGRGEGGSLKISQLDASLRDMLLPLVDVATLAQVLRITPRRIQQLTNEGILLRASRGKYPLGLACRDYTSWLREERDEVED